MSMARHHAEWLSLVETSGPFPADGTNSKSGQTVNALTASGVVRSDIRSCFGDLTGTADGVQLDLEIGVPGNQAAQSDAIADTIDYAKVVQRIEESLRDNKIQLLEKLAEHIAQIVIGEFKAPWVKVSVAKLAALKNVKQLGVTIERGSRTKITQ